MRLSVCIVACVWSGASSPVSGDTTFGPRHGHLSFTKDKTEMRVDWNMPPGTPQDDGYVVYGTSPAALTQKALARSYTYTVDELCGSPANETANWVDPGYMYTAVMTNLTQGDNVFYAYGTSGSNLSAVAQFHVGPKSSIQTSFIAYGDMPEGGAIDKNSTRLTLQHLSDVDAVIHVGDISYSMGTAAANHTSKWDNWFEEIEPIARAVPYHVCPGNHEFDWPGQSFSDPLFSYMHDSGGECGIPYDRRFNMPGPPFKTEGDFLTNSTNLYHSFEFGSVHVALISSEHDMREGSEQYKWLAADLAAVDRSSTPWLVFGMHRPFYGNSYASIIPEYGIMRDALEPLLLQNKVDLALFGHIHQYQRTCRMAKHKCDPAGPVYMVVGTAGATTQLPFFPQKEWVQKQSMDFGISKFTAVNATAMHVQWFLDANGTVGDDFWITR